MALQQLEGSQRKKQGGAMGKGAWRAPRWPCSPCTGACAQAASRLGGEEGPLRGEVSAEPALSTAGCGGAA